MDINNLWSGYDLNSKKQNSRCLAVNTILEGKYLVGPVLGQGGFGITYVGYDLNMETKVAIKEYFPVELVSRDTTTMHGDRVLSLSGEKSVTYKTGLKKYVAEAQNVSQFSEIPGVVSVKDFFYANETAYIVMEFIDGISLKDYLKEQGGRLSEEATLAIMKPVLEALVQVHKSGIIHRDISPDNIMLTFEGSGHGKIKSVKLIDFGAARMTAKNDQKSLTIILKHGYAPEEQYRTHGEQGPWTDVYALCAVLYRMLTGETPVPAMDRMFKDELKTPEQCGAKVSANTSAAILKGLAVKKDDRIQSVQELIEVLYEGVKIKAAKSNKTTVASVKKAAWIAGVGAVVCLASVGIVIGRGGKESSNTLKQRTDAEETIAVSMEQAFKQQPEDETVSEIIVDMDKNEELGEQIVFNNPMRSMAVSDSGSHMLFCMSDGTVAARGIDDEGQCDVNLWDHVASVEAGSFSSYGLRTDGTILFAGSDKYGYEQATLWTDIVDIQADMLFVIGLRKDGHVVCAGNSEVAKEISDGISEWENIKAIATKAHTAYGLTEDGKILCAGSHYSSSNTIPEEGIAGWEDVKYITWCLGRMIGICDDGTTRVASINPSGMELQDNEPSVLDEKLIFYRGELGVGKDGKVFVEFGSVPDGVENWTNLQSIINYEDTVYYGLQTDGTILEYPAFKMETFSAGMKNLTWIQTVSEDQYGMEGLIAVAKDRGVHIYGNILEKDNLLSHNSNLKWYNGHSALYEDGTALIEITEDGEIERFSGVQQIEEMTWKSGGDRIRCTYILLMKDGTVKRYQHGLDTEEDASTLENYEEYADVESWTNVKQLVGWSDWHVMGIKEDGSLVYAGKESAFYDNVENLNETGIRCRQVQVNEGTIGFYLTEDGELYKIWNNVTKKERGLSNADGWTNVVQFALGETHIVALQSDGTVKAVGSNHCGQCDVEEWKNVVYVTVGRNCTLGITESGDLLMAGSLY